MDHTYRVITQGIKPGADLDAVAHKVETLFKCSRADIEPLLAARRSVVKKRLTEAAATKYMSALGNCGLLASVESESPQAAPAAPAPVTPQPTAAPPLPNAAAQAAAAALTHENALTAIAGREEAAERTRKVKIGAAVAAGLFLLWMARYLL